MVCRTSRLLWVGVCLVAVVSAVQAAEPQANNAAASPARLGKAIKSEHAKAAPQAASRKVSAAAVKPAAYRGRDSAPASNTYQAHTRPGYNSDYSRMPTDSYARTPPHTSHNEPSPDYAGGYGGYPNANPGYQARGHETPDAQAGGYYPGTPSQPIRGYQPPYAGNGYDKYPSNSYPSNGYDKYPSSSYSPNGYDKYGSSSYSSNGYDKYPSHGYSANGYDKYSSSSYDSMQQYPGAAYQQPYSEQYQGGYQAAPSDPYSRAKPQPQEPYWYSYKQAGQPNNAAGYAVMPPGSSYTVYGRERAAEHARNQLTLRGVYRVSNEGSTVTPAPFGAVKVHQPTVLHLEDTYKQQQQQQLLSNVLAGNGLGSSGGYGGAYKHMQYGMDVTGVSQGGAYESQQWWKDHQQVQEGTKKLGSTDKLDALLSIINKLAP